MSANTNSLMERLPCSMVERIDYGQEASLSKVRHEHSVIKDRRRVHYCRTGCWCLQGHSHPAVIMLRPTPWRMQLEFHLRDLSFMSAEHDVKPGHSAGRSITKRHAVSNKLSRWDASVTHLISLLDTACPFVEKMLLLTVAFFIVPPFLQLIKRWLSSFQYTSFPAITYNPFFSLTFAHTDVRKH